MRIKILFLTIFFLLLLKTAYSLKSYINQYDKRIYKGVYIDGRSVSGLTKNDIARYYVEKNKKIKNIKLTVFFRNEPQATFSAEKLKIRYDSQTPAIQAYLIGRSNRKSSSFFQIFLSFFNLKKFYFESGIDYDKSLVNEFLNAIEEKYNKPAQNALFKFESGRVTSFKKEKKGVEIDSSSFMKEFDSNIKAIKKNAFRTKLKIVEKIIYPEITLSSINDYGIEEEIATGVSNYSHSINERVHNLILASSKFNGVLIAPGETLSFNKTVGDISNLTGYKPAYIIKEGKTVLGDGGGVCQVSTTLFRAALNAGLDIVERQPHAYRVSYYENDSSAGYDATVFSPSVDLKIRNNTTSHILISTEIDQTQNLLFFHLFGKKDGRQIEVGKAVIWDQTPPPPDKYQDDPTLKKGTVRQVDFPAWGTKAYFSYKVIKDKQVVIDKKFYSFYKPWAAVFMVGVAD